MNFDRYLDGNWQDGAAIGGGAILGVMGTRTIDNLAQGRMHPLVLFGTKLLFAFGAGTFLHGAGYDRLATGLVFGGFADGTITYADQIQYRYLPGGPGTPNLPHLPSGS